MRLYLIRHGKTAANEQHLYCGSTDLPLSETGIQELKMKSIPELEKLLSRNEDTVLITHGGTIAIIMEALFAEENKNRYEWQPKPGSGYLVENGIYALL